MDLFLNLIVVFLIMYCLLKIKYVYESVKDIDKKVIDHVMKENTNNYSQLESLVAVYCDLKLETSLPRTRGWAASPDFLRQISDYTLREKPLSIIECGSGVTTFALARSLQLNGVGHLVSLEHDLKYAEKTKQMLKINNLHKWATVVYAPLSPQNIGGVDYVWYSNLKDLNLMEVDMLVVDGPPEATCSNARYPAGPIICNNSKNLRAIFLHDSDREDEKYIVNKWCEELTVKSIDDLECEKGAVKLNL